MPRCPKCGNLIDHLLYHVIEYRVYEFDREGDLACIDGEVVESEGYCCPCCGYRLFWDEDEALDFLNGIDGNEIDDWED